ncbi:hypothetical protein PO909_031268 [Leuciscus waleckii]
MISQDYGLTLSAAPQLRRGSTPLPIKHQLRREEAVSEDYDWAPGLNEPATPQISVTNTQDSPSLKLPQQKYHGPLRIVLLGQNGVGKSSLALCLAGLSDRSLSIDSETQATDEGYQRRVTVDDEDSSILVFDSWKQSRAKRVRAVAGKTPDSPHSIISLSLFCHFSLSKHPSFSPSNHPALFLGGTSHHVTSDLTHCVIFYTRSPVAMATDGYSKQKDLR